MKKLLFSTFIILAFSAGYVNAKPQAQIKKKTINYPYVIEGKKLIHAFQIKNKGDEILKINNVKARG